MSVDAVALAGVVTAPMVAGVVAIIIHRQRLAHERRENDMHALRAVLARANGAQYRWMEAMRTVGKGLLPLEARVDALEAANLARGEFFQEVLNLRFLVDDGHPLITASYALDDAFATHTPHLEHTLPPRQELAPAGALQQIEPTMSRWFEVAHATARATL